jgi:hypothetical protein
LEAEVGFLKTHSSKALDRVMSVESDLKIEQECRQQLQTSSVTDRERMEEARHELIILKTVEKVRSNNPLGVDYTCVFNVQIGFAVNRPLHLNADWMCSRFNVVHCSKNKHQKRTSKNACRSAMACSGVSRCRDRSHILLHI